MPASSVQIQAIYQNYGGRAPNAAEIATWTIQIQNGSASLNTLRAAVVDDVMGQTYLPGAIAREYQAFGGRAPTAAEIATWMWQFRNVGADLNTLKTAIVDDVMGQTYLPAAIAQEYREFGGRSPTSAEITDWVWHIRNAGADLDTLKTAVIDDVMGQTYLPTAITQVYQQYGGRAPSAAEIADWTWHFRNAGSTMATLTNAVANDVMGQNYLPTAIAQQYQTYGGRAPNAAEISTWVYQIQHNGTTLDTLRMAVVDDVMGQTYLPAAINQVYQTWGGRAVQAPEAAYWMGAMRNGTATLATLKTAVIDDILGRTYLPTVIAQQYLAWGGRAPTSGETSYWMGAMRDLGATSASLKLAILNDPLGAGYASSQLTAYFAAANKTAPSDAEVQSLLALLRTGTAYADAEATLAQAHPGTIAVNPYATATYEAYGAYLGRAPSAAEIDQWSHTLTSANTAAAQLRASLLPSAEGQAHLTAQITAEYQQYGDRAPTTTELASWQTAIQSNGAAPDAIRVAILSTPLGQAHASDAITAEYQEYFGRVATAGELQTALATLATNQDYAATHQALFTASESIVHFYDSLHQLYTSLLGHDYATADQSQWFDQIFFHNASYATIRASLMLDPTSTAAHIVGTAAADTIAIHGAGGETTISNFNAAADKIRLDSANYGGTNLLDATHAREVMSTDGVTPNVLITLDANDHILLHGVNLAELSASNFLFG